MRVLFIIHELAPNGAVVALYEQARWLLANGHAVRVLTPPLDGPAAALLARFEAAGIPIGSSAVWAEHDVVVGCTIFAADALFDLIGRLPVVWWIHEGIAGVRAVLAQPKAAHVLARADRLIFPSRAVAERLFGPMLTHGAPGRMDVVAGIVAPPAPGETAPKAPGTIRVLCVGSVYPRKRQSDLVQAVARLRGASLECVLVGEMHTIEEPGASIVQADPARFRLTGGLAPEQVHALYRSADVFSLPSADESMPLAPVEAAWHGVPVVLSDLACYEGVWKHGHNALIHPLGDVEMLAWCLRMLVESGDLRRRMIDGARRITALFSERRAGPAFETVLADAMAGWHPSGA
ncbi:MAG: glycosyltransferase family 4 protein [Acetobacteraceae bacterium]